MLQTQELSEIVIIFGAKAEVGNLGVIVPLTDGVFNPCRGQVSSAHGWNTISAIDDADGETHHQAASVAHGAQWHWPLRQRGRSHGTRRLARHQVGCRLVGLY